MKVESPNKAQHEPLVRNIMQSGVITATESMSVRELATLLNSKMISGVPVVNATGEVVGVVSLTDIVAHTATANQSPSKITCGYYSDAGFDSAETADQFIVEDFGEDIAVSEIMTPHVHVVRDTDTLPDVVWFLLNTRIHRVLVTDGKSVVGIVTTTDLIRVIPGLMEQVRELRP